MKKGCKGGRAYHEHGRMLKREITDDELIL
jgi:hypothetical protein